MHILKLIGKGIVSMGATLALLAVILAILLASKYLADIIIPWLLQVDWVVVAGVGMFLFAWWRMHVALFPKSE